jgi:predicted dehydrogenase
MLNTLIIGCGNIAGRFDEMRDVGAPPLTHAGAYRAHGGFGVAACIDPDGKRRSAFQSHWGIDIGAASWGDLGAKPGDFDVISICSPTANHVEDLGAAMALKPRLVFAEKPVTGTADETAAWVSRYADAGILLAVNHTRRWAPDVAELAAQIKAGQHGAVRSANAIYSKGIGNNGSHMVDLLHHLLGDDLQLVQAGEPRWDFWDSDPSVPALLKTSSGIPVALNIGHAADYALFEMRIVTETGTMEMLDGGMRWSLREAAEDGEFDGYRTLQPALNVDGRYSEAMLAAVANIHDAVNSDTPLACDGSIALTAQRMCDAIKSDAMAHIKSFF